ncbi:MAG: hypothetical protein J6V58_03565 [Clostridia bacterium]|nr:hypothetical protein [Clostridia bacterium]
MISLDNVVEFGQFTTDGIFKFEKSFSFTYISEKSNGCIILNSMAFYVGEEAPKIQFNLTAKEQDVPFYSSHRYKIGKCADFTRQSWRVPPLFLQGTKLTVNIQIPSGTVLFVKNFNSTIDKGGNSLCCGLKHNAHLGFWGLAPDNTMPAFELAAECNFQSCIAVPKVTLDGVIVCIHDDTINRTARDSNGDAPSEPIYVWDKTYEELSNWEYGSYKNEIYKGTKLPRLSEFFDLCAKTGMRPIFSTHPGLTIDQWKQVKDMLECRGLLSSFHIKSFDIDILETAYSVFGTDIDGYTYDLDNFDDTQIELLKNIGIDNKVCRVGIEVKFAEYTEQIAKSIREAGFFAAAWDIAQRDFDEYERLISWGVNEFTEDYHCSMGLNY